MMKRYFKTTTCLSVSAIAVLASLAAAPAAFAAEPAAAASDDMGGITVTARKRSEDILKVPVTISAMTSAALEARGIATITDLATSTPGLSVNNSSSGHADRSFQQIVLRGFTPSTTLATTTAMFIDGVAVSSPSQVGSVSDPAQVDVVKGPQSAFYGRNTFAGAINVTTKEPKGEWAGSMTGMVGTRANYRLQGTVEGPIFGEALTFRVTGERYSKNGSWVNAYDGKTLGDQKTTTGTALLVFKPATNLTIKLFGMMSEDSDGAPAQTRLYAYDIKTASGTVLAANQSNCSFVGNTRGVLGQPAPTLPNNYICGTVPGLINPISANVTNTEQVRQFLAGAANRVIPAEDSVKGYGLLRKTQHAHTAINYKITPELTADLLAGYNREVFSTLIDLDGFDSSALPTSTTPAAAINPKGYFDFPFLVERRNMDWSVEGRLAYNHGPLRAVAGVSYLKADTWSGGGGGTGVLALTSTSASGKSENRTTGAFFGLTYDVLSNVSASLEGRYQIDTLSLYTRAAGQTILSSAFIPAGTYAGGSLLAEKTYKNFTPRAIVNWQITPRTMVYASWAKGVNPAQFNGTIVSQSASVQAAALGAGGQLSIEPEKITNYEVGLKGKALNGALRYTAAAYYAQWRNQINAITIVAPDTTTSTGYSFINTSANSGSVDLYGMEFDTVWKINDLVTLEAAAAYNGSSIKSLKNTTLSQLTGIFDFSGKEMKYTSKYSSNVGVTLASDLPGVADGKWFTRLDWNFKSGMWSNEANTTKTPDAHKFNLRAGVSKGKIAVDVFVNNLLNDKTYASLTDNYVLDNTFAHTAYNSALMVGLPDLRTFGLQVKVKF
jgi:iron complex outermembrane receptor protein